MSVKKPILRKILDKNVLILPDKQYSKSIYAITNDMGEVFSLYLKNLSFEEICDNLTQRNSIPKDTVEKAYDMFQKLSDHQEEEISIQAWRDSTSKEINDLDRYSLSQSFPLYAGIEPTWRCNFRCKHCYIQSGDKPELSVEDWKCILDDMAAFGVLYLTITGGEPFLYRSFEELYLYAKQKGFIITIFTNGVLVNDSHIELFSAYPPKAIEISLYGVTKKTYATVTGNPDSFERFLAGFQKLYGLVESNDIVLKTTIIRENVHEYSTMQQFASQFSCSLASNFIVWPGISSDKSNISSQLPPKDVIKLEDEDLSVSSNWLEYPDNTPITRDESKIIDCCAGKAAFIVDSEGYLGYCMSYRKPHINLLQHKLQNFWSDLCKNRIRWLKKPERCINCKYNNFCDFCPACGELLDNDGKSDIISYVCEVAEARFKYYTKQ